MAKIRLLLAWVLLLAIALLVPNSPQPKLIVRFKRI